MLGFNLLWKEAALVTEEPLLWMTGLFIVPRLKDRLLPTVRVLSMGLGLELRRMREWAAEPMLLLLKAKDGGWSPPPCSSVALLWLRKKWQEDGEIGVETGEFEEKDGMSSTSSVSKDLFSAADGKKKCPIH